MVVLKEKHPDRMILLYLVAEPKYPFSFKRKMELLVRVMESSPCMTDNEFILAVTSTGNKRVENDYALANFLKEFGYPVLLETPRSELLVSVLDNVQHYMLHRVAMIGHDDPVPQLIRRFYSRLPKAFSFSDEEQLAWEQHPLGEWFPVDDPLTIAFTCMALPSHAYSVPTKLELIRTCCDVSLRDFATFLLGAKYVARDIPSLINWINRTQRLRPVSSGSTIRYMPIKMKISGLDAFITQAASSDDAAVRKLAQETAELFESKFF